MMQVNRVVGNSTFLGFGGALLADLLGLAGGELVRQAKLGRFLASLLGVEAHQLDATLQAFAVAGQ
jgi:hypothetical protein